VGSCYPALGKKKGVPSPGVVVPGKRRVQETRCAPRRRQDNPYPKVWTREKTSASSGPILCRKKLAKRPKPTVVGGGWEKPLLSAEKILSEESLETPYGVSSIKTRPKKTAFLRKQPGRKGNLDPTHRSGIADEGGGKERGFLRENFTIWEENQMLSGELMLSTHTLVGGKGRAKGRNGRLAAKTGAWGRNPLTYTLRKSGLPYGSSQECAQKKKKKQTVVKSEEAPLGGKKGGSACWPCEKRVSVRKKGGVGSELFPYAPRHRSCGKRTDREGRESTMSIGSGSSRTGESTY